jgi:hypothetical protein
MRGPFAPGALRGKGSSIAPMLKKLIILLLLVGCGVVAARRLKGD